MWKWRYWFPVIISKTKYVQLNENRVSHAVCKSGTRGTTYESLGFNLCTKNNLASFFLRFYYFAFFVPRQCFASFCSFVSDSIKRNFSSTCSGRSVQRASEKLFSREMICFPCSPMPFIFFHEIEKYWFRDASVFLFITPILFLDSRQITSDRNWRTIFFSFHLSLVLFYLWFFFWWNKFLIQFFSFGFNFVNLLNLFWWTNF